MVDTLNHPDLPLSPTRWRCLPAPETLMRIRKAKLLPRDEVGWISRNRLDSGRCLSLFLDIPFYRTQNSWRRHFECNGDLSPARRIEHWPAWRFAGSSELFFLPVLHETNQRL